MSADYYTSLSGGLGIILVGVVGLICAVIWLAWPPGKKRHKQHTFVYCPACRYELVSGGEWIGQDITDPSIEAYQCARCKVTSAWYFDAPTPLLVRSGFNPQENP
jgi:hypothetical protein